MKFSSVTQRIMGDSVDIWDVHYDGLARLARGEDIILLSVGQETSEVTPQPIVQAGIDSLHLGRHHYTPVQGTDSVREAIARRHYHITGQTVPAAQCAVFSGAQNALFAVCLCLLEHGDQVILIEPYYTTYPAAVSVSGASIVSVPARAENNFELNPDDVIAAMTPETRAVVLNSPNNPIGAVYKREQLAPLVQACTERGIWLINDEVYQEIIHPEHRASPCALPGAEKVCVTISSVSKSHRMTGWRLGWVIGPEDLMSHLYNLSMCMAYGLPEFIMDAATAALNTDFTTAVEIRENMARRRARFEQAFVEHPKLKIYSSAGGMFIVIDVTASGVSSRQFARELLDNFNVAVLPCDGFGSTGSGLIRISLCASDEQLQTACERMLQYVAQLPA